MGDTRTFLTFMRRLSDVQTTTKHHLKKNRQEEVK
jgi:hypothetical protein